MRIVSHPEDWNGMGAAALVLAVRSAAERRDALRRLAARALGVAAEDVAIEHRDGFAPRLVRPDSADVHLSSASRGGLAALAAARQPVGIDVEMVEPERTPPFNVLHPGERRALAALPEAERAREFARLWSCKEAYLKALGLGLAREPAAILVVPLDAALASVREGDARAAEAQTAWHAQAGRLFAISTVLLLQPATGSSTTS